MFKLKQRKCLGMILAIFISCTVWKVTAEETTGIYYTGYHVVELKGKAPLNLSGQNSFVTVLAKDGDEICHIGQTELSENGSYAYTFRVPSHSDDISVMIKAGNEDITSTLISVMSKSDWLANVDYITEDEGEKLKIYADVSDIRRYTAEYNVIIAAYNANDALSSLSITKGSEIQDNTVEAVVNKKDRFKIFVWGRLNELLPVGILQQNNKELKISFGKEMDNFYQNGYTQTLSGANNYERYQMSRSELPEELETLPVYEPNVFNKFYVSPKGLDTNPGTIDKPFRTIDKAVAAYNNLPSARKSWWTGIFLREGCYPNVGRLDLNGDAKVIISAYEGENITISSAKTVSGDKFEKVSDENTSPENLARINSEAKNKLYYCSYSDFGINKLNGFTYGNSGGEPMLLVNSELQTMARYPNAHDMKVSSVTEDGLDSNGKQKTEGVVSFKPDEQRPFEWKNTEQIGMRGQLSVSWYINHMQASIDTEKNIISVPVKQTLCTDPAGITQYKLNTHLQNDWTTDCHYYFYNVLEEIDMPGEWCAVDSENRIYFYPPRELTAEDTVKIQGNSNDAGIELSNVKNVIIEGMNFELENTGIRILNCENTIIQKCGFNNMGDLSVSIKESKKCGITHSEFMNCRRGVRIEDGIEYVKEITPAQCFVQNCHFNKIFGACVYIGDSCSNVVSHNLAENHITSFASVFGGCENVLEYNESKAGVLQGNEGNNFYLNGDFTARNNHIRYNYIHDNAPRESDIILGYALAADDLGEGWLIYGNIFENVSCGTYANGGDNNIFDSNIYINNGGYEKRKLFPSAAVDIMYGEGEDQKIPPTDRYRTSAVDPGGNNYFMKKYVKNDFMNSEKWNNRYPEAKRRYKNMAELEKIYSDKTNPTVSFSRAVTGTYITNSTFVNCPEVKINHAYLGEEPAPTYTYYDIPSGVTQYNGEDYNVYWNNMKQNTVDLNTVDKFARIGLLNEAEYKPDSLKLTYPGNGIPVFAAGRAGFVWNDISEANYYKVIVAEDESFTSGKRVYYTIDNRYSLSDLKDSGIYQYRIEAYKYTYGGNDRLLDVINGVFEIN